MTRIRKGLHVTFVRRVCFKKLIRVLLKIFDACFLEILPLRGFESTGHYRVCETGVYVCPAVTFSVVALATGGGSHELSS